MERIHDMDSKQRSCICGRHVEPQRHQSMDRSVRIELAASTALPYSFVFCKWKTEPPQVPDIECGWHTHLITHPSTKFGNTYKAPNATHYKVVLWQSRNNVGVEIWTFGQQNWATNAAARPLFRHLVACCLPMLSAARCPDSLQQQLRRLYQSSGGYHWKWRQRSQCLWLLET